MRKIIKTAPPKEFIEYCKTPGASFDGLSGADSVKKLLRKRLVEDQGYICCYCGRAIQNNEDTKIEHIKCQKDYGELALEYSNMLASCDGGDKDRCNRVRPRHQVHCDAKKENRDIPMSPLEDVEELFIFDDDGSVTGVGEGKELIRILGLDARFLQTQRKNAIDTYKDFEKCRIAFENEIVRLEEKKDGKFDPFCFVCKQYISNLLNIELGNLNSENQIPAERQKSEMDDVVAAK